MSEVRATARQLIAAGDAAIEVLDFAAEKKVCRGNAMVSRSVALAVLKQLGLEYAGPPATPPHTGEKP